MSNRTTNSSDILRNGQISLIDQTFPNANKFFIASPRTASGHFKWVDFGRRFWHKDSVASVSLASFADAFPKWCKRNGYSFSYEEAEKIHHAARNAVATLPKNDSTKY